MSTAALYLRVSTEEQVSNLSLDTQEAECRAYCDRHGWRDSHGSKLEVATALASGIPVKDIDGSSVRLLTIHAERRRKK